MTAMRAVRGAVQIDCDRPDLIVAGTQELLVQVMQRNGLAAEDIISIVFTMTPDLASGFPPAAARGPALPQGPLLCAGELGVPDALAGGIRPLARITTDRS